MFLKPVLQVLKTSLGIRGSNKDLPVHESWIKIEVFQSKNLLRRSDFYKNVEVV